MSSRFDALIEDAITRGLLPSNEADRARTQLMERLGHLHDFAEVSSLEALLDEIARYPHPDAVTMDQKDAWEAMVMDALMPSPATVKTTFTELLSQHGSLATDYLYRISTLSHYVKVDRNARNPSWSIHSPTPLQLTINLAKPEKDPRDIARLAQSTLKSPLGCLLCKENEQNDANGKRNLRIVPLQLHHQTWHFQYSPYAYFNEHSIVLSDDHRPMKIVADTLYNLFDFIHLFPDYFIGSNADLPIVGGSLLGHDHYQAGRHVFPLEHASSFYERQFTDYTLELVDWPLSTIKITSTSQNVIHRVFGQLLQGWKDYENPGIDIIARSGPIPHQAVTPILRRRSDDYVLYIILRNNRTTAQYPMGLFHPHEEYHHLKKENIGLIEAMGLAILPGRLLKESELIVNVLCHPHDPYPESIAHHRAWVNELQQLPGPYSIDWLRHQMGIRFLQLLHNCGVFKRDPVGEALFIDCVESILL